MYFFSLREFYFYARIAKHIMKKVEKIIIRKEMVGHRLRMI